MRSTGSSRPSAGRKPSIQDGPEDAIHGCAIIQEELGEAFKEAIDYSFHTAGAEMTVCLERLLEELAQTGAVTIRHMVQIAGMIELRNEEDQT